MGRFKPYFRSGAEGGGGGAMTGAEILSALGTELEGVDGPLVLTDDVIAAEAPATLAQYLTNTALLTTADVVRYFDETATLPYAETITLTLDGERLADGDDHDSSRLINETTDVSGNVTLNFTDIHAGLKGAAWSYRFVASTAAAHQVTVATVGGGATVELAPGVTIPAMGGQIGDAVVVVGVIDDTTNVTVERAYSDVA